MSVKATNPSAHYNYELLDKIEAGIVLTGAEVKSVKNGRVQLKDSYIKITPQGEAFLHNCFIAPYVHATPSLEYDPYRVRKILLNKQETYQLQGKTEGQNLTIVPVKMYTIRQGFIKLEIAVARGKRKYETRRREQEVDLKRKIDRTLKRYS
jgi:SsrA-binding protein